MDLWSSDSSTKPGKRKHENVPEAKYTRFGEKIRQALPGSMQCSMACGGRNCKWENPSKWADEDQVIKGVFSSWVLEDVVAMSRPSTEVIRQYDLIGQFKNCNICSIINLQRPGEHASCGPPLDKDSQFTYKPQTFMDNDIFFYNFGWKDYGVASLDTILDMVKVMTFALSEGKVAVHCHAGLGRTGVLIACFLTYAHRMDASSAIKTVRRQRPNSIQTRGQIACIQEFAQFLKPLRIVFPQVVPHAERLTLIEFLHRQRHLLHGVESRELRYTPKIVQIVCQRLVEIATTYGETEFHRPRVRANTGPKTIPKSGRRSYRGQVRRSNTIATLKESLPGAFVNEHLEKTENSLDPMDSQEINALLSPRLRRRNDSAKSKASSSSKSLSGPGSPILSMHNDDVPDSPSSGENPSKQSSTTILVSSITESTSTNVPTELDSTAEEKTPGKPQVVLVKQGSRSALLPAATNITQMGIDININNNNQLVSNVKVSSFSDNNSCETSDCKVRASSKDSCQSPSRDVARFEIEKTTKTTTLPSPTPSVHEPVLSSSSKEDRNERTKSAGEKVAAQNHRPSMVHSQRVVPTGMPMRNRAGSGKGKRINLFDDDDAKYEKDTEDADEQEASDKLQQTENSHEDEAKIEECSKQTEYVANEEKEVDADEYEEDIVILVNDVDNELEVIEMQNDDAPSLSDSELEDSAENMNQENDLLSQSVASKLSWTEKRCKEDTDEDSNNVEVPSSGRGSRTPLMYRAEHNQERITDADVDDSGASSDGEIFETDQGVVESDTNRGAENDTEMLSENQTSTNDPTRERPKSSRAHRENTLVPHCLPLRTLTQSLCDLRKYDDVSRDDLVVLTSGMTYDLCLPLSPVRSSSSDDVRTPQGSATKKRIKDPITVAMALAYKLTDNEWLWEKVYTKQVELNTRVGAWLDVEQEADAHLLSCLMWSWIEHLKQPVLSMHDIEWLVKQSRPIDVKSTLASECPDPTLLENALESLGKHVFSTFHCVLRCLLSLPPLSYELEASVVRRVLSAFTQTNFLDDEEQHESERYKLLHQLVSLIQNYLVKTRLREQKKSVSGDNKSSSRRKGETSQTTSKNEDSTSESDSVTGGGETRKKSTSKQEDDGCNAKYMHDESDSSSATSSVVELPPRIAVS